MQSHERVELAKKATDINCWNVVKMADDYKKYSPKFIEILSEL